MSTEKKDLLSEQEKKSRFPKRKIKIQKKEKKSFDGYYLIAAFCIPFLLMLAVYICLEKHPFGNNTVLTLDMQAQYAYYFEALRRLLTEGGSWLYSWERTLGGEFMGIISYYLASPFNLLIVLFPKSMIPDAIMFVQLVKVGAMGVTFAYYLRKTRKTSDMLSISFGVMYALSAHAVVQLCNIMWLDAMVFLPLLALGIESMIRERKFILYTAMLVTVFCTNYYIGYMCAIFTFFYFLYYFMLVRKELPQNESAKEGSLLKRLFHSNGFETLMRFGVFSVLALMISAFVLLCALYSLSFGKSDFSNPSFAPTLNFEFLDLFVKMLPGSYDNVRPGGLPMIYCGILAVIAIPLFFMSSAISKRKKVLSAAMLGFLLISFLVNPVDLAWHGFSAPNWLEFRNSFIAIFFLLILACDGLRTVQKVSFGKILTASVTISLLVMIVQKFDYVFDQGPDTKPLDDTKCILLSLGLIAIYSIILYFFRQAKWQNAASFALAAIVCVEMFVGALMNVVDLEADVGSIRYGNWKDGNREYYTGYTGAIKRVEGIIGEVAKKDQGFYRMESTIYRKQGGVNEPLALGIKGISHSTSTLNSSVIKLLKRLGYSSQSHWSKYLGGTPITDALLGIKYVVTKDNTLDPNFYNEVASVDEYYEFIPSKDKIYAMQNTKALSIAYGVNEEVLDLEDFIAEPLYLNALKQQNQLINKMFANRASYYDVLKPIGATPTGDVRAIAYTHTFKKTDENGEEVDLPNAFYVFENKKNANGDGSVYFKFNAKADAPIYMHLPGYLFAGSASKTTIYVKSYEGESTNVKSSKSFTYFTNETWTVQNIGTFDKGDRVEVEVKFEGGPLYVSQEDKYYFYYVDYAQMNKVFSELSMNSMTVLEYGNDFLKGTIDLPEGQELIFTTIPYDEGWKVYIDGKRVDTVMALDSLLAIPSTAGFHDIEFVYRPDCAVYGGLISVIGIVLFALAIVWSRMRRVRALVKCDNGKTKHFFHYEGDSVTAWNCEALENEACKELSPENTEENTERDEKTKDAKER
ncbi:MAG: YfhO family protein [Clostridia bacterium]|nr:YfhO family protein [Clostridia bacterium]